MIRSTFPLLSSLFLASLLSLPVNGAGLEGAPVGPQSPAIDLSAYASVYHVDVASGDDIDGDGSMERPWRSITHAMEESGEASADRLAAILVSRGRYVQPTFALRPYAHLFGGFAKPGGERDVITHATVLDGMEDRRILFGADHARLDGFHLIDGRVRGKGAALVCDGTSPTVANCVFTGNRTLIPRPWEPRLLHETAHDGGAVMILNGASPVIENNYFFDNATECGRGGAMAVDRRSSPVVRGNVFANNLAGLVDPMRSSDGGALSYFEWSGGEFSGNILVANQALTSNDAGGIFIALWSAPVFANNVLVANVSGDDAGGLFIGGQEHRYGVPLDEYPPAGSFNVAVTGNVFVGNENSSRNSGAMRITMESRVLFTGNIVAENEGGAYFQRSEIIAENNTIWQDWRFLEDKPSLAPSRMVGNILKGPVAAVEARVSIRDNMSEPLPRASGTIPVADVFEDDGIVGEIDGVEFRRSTMTTVVTLKRSLPPGDYSGRSIDIGGQWRVIKSAARNEVELWGRLEATTGEPDEFEILRTFTLSRDAPRGMGAGAR